MQRRQYSTIPLLHTGLCALMLLGAVSLGQAQDKKADPAGKWAWTVPGRNGGADRKMTLQIKAEGDKLTGKVITPGRNGDTETEIKDAKMKGDELTFTVTVERGGNTMTTKYTGKVTADAIKGKRVTERDGKAGRESDWEAKKDVAK